jgi:hypothetical protein
MKKEIEVRGRKYLFEINRNRKYLDVFDAETEDRLFTVNRPKSGVDVELAIICYYKGFSAGQIVGAYKKLTDIQGALKHALGLRFEK